MKSISGTVRLLFIILLAVALLVASCNTPTLAPAEYVSDMGCTSESKDLYFTITNIGAKPLSLQEAKSGSELITIEVNNLELTGLVNYCGRPTLAPNEVVKCRRPGTSKTDAGLKLNIGRNLVFFKSQNTIRVKEGDTTKEIQVMCA